jgi:hypothetical protein
VVRRWRERLAESEQRIPARRLYAGRGFKEALSAVEACGADVWIVSAGLGLVYGVTWGLDTTSPSPFCQTDTFMRKHEQS